MAFFCEKKVKVQVYSLISNISSDFYIFTPWSLDLFIVYLLNSTESIYSPAAISAQQTYDTHCNLCPTSQMEHSRVK